MSWFVLYLVTLIGGVVFLLFAVTAFLHDPNSEPEVAVN